MALKKRYDTSANDIGRMCLTLGLEALERLQAETPAVLPGAGGEPEEGGDAVVLKITPS